MDGDRIGTLIAGYLKEVRVLFLYKVCDSIKRICLFGLGKIAFSNRLGIRDFYL